MKPETYKLFAQLCETFLPEVSSSLSLIKGHPGGNEVVKKLHAEKGLGHAQTYNEVPKISWNELKDSYRGAWVIIQGQKGTGAIRASRGSYEAMASTGGEIESFRNDRGGNILDFLKERIGKMTKFYVGKDSGKTGELKSTRAERNKVAGPAVVNQDTLVKKFKPLWVRAITAAIADSKGHVANMIKNDAFEKAKKKLNQIQNLQDGLESLEAGNLDDAPDFIRSAVNTAIMMAAAHYYPEETGEIQRSRWGSSGNYTSQRDQGPRQLLSDIAGGDTKKLGTILAFFKRALISG